MKLKTLQLSLCLLFFSSPALAEELQVWHGWMNLTPCTTVEWRNGFLGIPSPTYKESPQELHGYIYADVATGQELTSQIQQDCIECGYHAGVIATTVAILTTGAGGWSTFTAAFWDCLSNRVQTYSVVRNVRLETESKCT